MDTLCASKTGPHSSGERSCASDDTLKRRIDTQLSDGAVATVQGISKSHRGTGRPCIVCRRPIEPADVERELEGAGVLFHAHETCYKPWREEISCSPEDGVKVLTPEQQSQRLVKVSA